VAGDDKHRDRRQQGDVSALADGVIGKEPAHHRHQQIGQQRQTEVGLLHHQQQADAGADQSTVGALHGFLADIAVVLQTADHDQHGHRRPLTVGQVDAGGQQDRRQQANGHAHGVDQLGMAIATVRVEQRAQQAPGKHRQMQVNQLLAFL